MPMFLPAAVFLASIKTIPGGIVLSNGLVERRIHLNKFVGTYSMQRLDSKTEYLRSVEPEAKLVIGGKEVWLGGTTPVPNRAFFQEEWIASLQPSPLSLPFLGQELVPCKAHVPFKPIKGQSWPPHGKAVLLKFGNTSLSATIRYEIYDGLPVVSKEVEVKNLAPTPVRVDQVISERLAMVEAESNVESQKGWRLPNLSVFTNESFGGQFNSSIFWEEDPDYTTQVSYMLKTPCVLSVHPPTGPGVDLKQGESLTSPRSHLVLHGSEERELQTLDNRKFFRTMAPWILDNPTMFHLRASGSKEVKAGVDQAAECGFEMVILSFGSGLNMEDVSEKNIAKFRELRQYATSKGVRLGGYSLLASRRVDDENDVINPATGKTGGAIFGSSPCLGSKWGIQYFENIKKFIAETGFDILEHDGNYPGDVCASKNHPGHRDLADSQWMQYKMITDFYSWCRERNVFLNVPDTYFLNGSNKTGMGYRETNWSLPREQQHVHARQNRFDGTWDKTPSMGWMFVPLVEYQGGGAAATIEPLKDHLQDYELHFANNFGFGVQACWRGVRLYDTEETKAMVVRMVNWFKKYRSLLESDIVHLRRADGRRLDYVMHVEESTGKMMLMVYNPTLRPLSETLSIPVGERQKISVTHGEEKSIVKNTKGGLLNLAVTIPAKGWTYYILK
ncbi:MAG: alpha-galactosidase [Armatimonadota bacterium]